MPDLADLDALGAAAVYLVVVGFVFVECGLLVGFFLPGDTLLFAGGLVAAGGFRWWRARRLAEHGLEADGR